MNNIGKPTPVYCWLLLACVCVVTGCQQLRIPAIDPSGDRVFLPQSESTQLARISDSRCTSSSALFLKPAWQPPLTPPPCPGPAPTKPAAAPAGQAAARSRPLRGVPGTIRVNPTRMIAPVGSEVVLVGGLRGEDGELIARQPIEWMLSQDSVGQIVDVSDRDCLWHKSRKLATGYAVTRTASRSQVVTRGTPSVTDDVVQQAGQSWISLTSASEGTSYVTVVASEGATWPQRRQTATVYWVDAQWVLPGPATARAGQSHVLTTLVTRTETNAPVPGWIIRYEVVGGVPATVGAGGVTAIEVPTDTEGRATVPLQPATGEPGTTQVRIQIIRPADPGSAAPRAIIGEGYTTVAWSAPGLAIRASGPESAAVDATLVYELEVVNTGDTLTRGVVIRDVLPPNLQFLSSQPPAQIFGQRAEWRLGDLAPMGSQRIQVNVRAIAAGGLRYVFQATSSDGLRAETSVDTNIIRQALELRVTGPESAAVGDRIQYHIEVTNSGEQPLDNVVVTDRYDAGLEQTEGQTSPIEQSIGRIAPGDTQQVAVGFVVRQAGRLCHTVEAASPGGQFAQQQICLTATAPEVARRPNLQLLKKGPTRAFVGQSVRFTIDVTNTGNVPLTDVQIADSYDQPLEPTGCSRDWDRDAYDAGQLLWKITRLVPGETVQREVRCLCAGPAAAATSRASVTTAENISQSAQAVVEILAATEPPPANTTADTPDADGQLSVDISEFGDAVTIGEKTVYLITIRNERQVSDRNVVLNIQFPAGLDFEKLSGPVTLRTVSPDGRTLRVSPIREIRAGETLSPFRIEAVGKAPGEHELVVTVTSERSPQGVTARETTSVFGQ